MSSIDVETLDDEHEQRHDFRRANGAPLVSDPNDPTKTLRYSRPSSYAKCLDDEKALESWRLWRSMTGVARSKALAAEVNACKDDDRVQKEALRNKALDKGEANEKADMGTALHAMTARAEDVTDIDFDPPEQYVADLDAYRDTLATYGLVSEMAEIALVNDQFRAAGHADRIFRSTMPLIPPDGVRIEPGDLVLGDLKTGKKLDFGMPNYCVQVALYASSQLYDIATDRRLPTPPINQQWGMMIHLPVGTGRCEVLWVSLTDGLYGAWLAHEVKEWRRKWKNGEYDCPAVGVPVDQPEPSSDPVDVSLEAMVEYAQRRITTIGDYDKAKAELIARWPSDLPTPRKGIKTAKELVRVLHILDTIETQYSIPFIHSDPRTPFHTGHKSQANRDDDFMLTQ